MNIARVRLHANINNIRNIRKQLLLNTQTPSTKINPEKLQHYIHDGVFLCIYYLYFIHARGSKYIGAHQHYPVIGMPTFLPA